MADYGGNWGNVKGSMNALSLTLQIDCFPSQYRTNSVLLNCAVPEIIHSHPKEGHRKFLGGRGVLNIKIL